jgi:hypothetical protein
MNASRFTTRQIVIFAGLLLVAGVVIILLTSTAPTPAPPAPGGTAAPDGIFGPKPALTPADTDPRVFFFDPQDGDAVDSPVYVRIGVANFTIGGGAVHLYVTIDSDCVPPGQPIPEDDHHVSLGKDKVNTMLALPIGPHRLCAQAADAQGVALEGAGMIQVIDVNVNSVPVTEHPNG